VARVGELGRQVAVIGEDQQALGVEVEASDRIHGFAHPGEEIHHRGPALRIHARGDVAGGLVEQDVAVPLRPFHAAAVHPDVVGGGIGLDAHLTRHDAVHGDASLGHEPLGGAP